MLGFALDAVVDQVNTTKNAFVSRKLSRPEGLADPARVEERWSFRNLLGAMYLQMYLLVADGERNSTRSALLRKAQRLFVRPPKKS